METFGHGVTSLELVPLGGGVFEVFVDGARIFSKAELKRHAEPGEIVSLLEAR